MIGHLSESTRGMDRVAVPLVSNWQTQGARAGA
jgi:hypothetical protein